MIILLPRYDALLLVSPNLLFKTLILWKSPPRFFKSSPSFYLMYKNETLLGHLLSFFFFKEQGLKLENLEMYFRQ